MKKSIIFTVLFSLSLVMFSFSSPHSISHLITTETKEEQPNKIRIKVRFKWDGIGGPTNPCYGNGPCGDCFGVCIAVTFRTGTISEFERKEGDGYAIVYLNNDNTLTLIPEENSMDDGRGLVTIKSDFNIGDEVSKLMSDKPLIIKTGNYKIDYSDGLKFGKVNFALN